MPTRSRTQRRSKRLALSIPVRIYGRTPQNEPFRYFTETKLVSAHGGLVPLPAKVKRGQTLLLVHGFTEEARQCRVVYIDSESRRPKVGIEFVQADGDFWHVYSPMVVARGAKLKESENPRVGDSLL